MNLGNIATEGGDGIDFLVMWEGSSMIDRSYGTGLEGEWTEQSILPGG